MDTMYYRFNCHGLLLGLFMVVLNAPLPQGTSPFYDYSALILRLNNDSAIVVGKYD